MSKFKKLIKSGHIHVALALGMSIILLLYVSKRVLAEPMEPIYFSITSLIMLGYETAVGSRKIKHTQNSIYWILAIVVATAVIILLHIL
jgi:hypothetical protein